MIEATWCAPNHQGYRGFGLIHIEGKSLCHPEHFRESACGRSGIVSGVLPCILEKSSSP